MLYTSRKLWNPYCTFAPNGVDVFSYLHPLDRRNMNLVESERVDELKRVHFGERVHKGLMGGERSENMLIIESRISKGDGINKATLSVNIHPSLRSQNSLFQRLRDLCD